MRTVHFVRLPQDIVDALDRIQANTRAKHRLDVIRQTILWLSRQSADVQRFVTGYPWMRHPQLPMIDRRADQSFDRNVELALGDLIVIASALYPHEIREYQQDMIETLTTVPPAADSPPSDAASAAQDDAFGVR